MKILARTLFVVGLFWLVAAALLTKPVVEAASLGFVSDYYGQEKFTQDEFREITGKLTKKIARAIPEISVPVLLVTIAWLSEIFIRRKRDKVEKAHT
jgi:hypothetical protein